jgi:hypothetical protein
MATIKKAQYGDRITSRQKKRLGRISEKNPERAKEVAERMKLRATRRKRGSDLYDSLSPKEDLPAFKARTLEEAKKAKNGKSFPDLNKDGKITKADILKGRGVIAKKGANIKKAQNGDTTKVLKPKGRTDMAGGDLFDRFRREKSIRSMSKDSDAARRREMMMKTLEKPRKSSANKPSGMKLGGKIKKAQAGLVASDKRVGPIDPKGAWTKVQEMNLPPRNVKTSVSLKKDKQLGATKMMKMGGKAKKKK